MRKPNSTPRRKELVRPLPRLDVAAARPVAHLEERSAIRYPSLTSVSMEALSALLDEAVRVVRRPAMAGAVGLAIMASGCEDAREVPAATLVPLGETHDMAERDAPEKLELPGAGGWGSLAGGSGGSSNGGGSGGGSGSALTPCDPGLSTDVDGGVDAGVDAGRRIIPTHNTPHLRGRMPIVRPIRTAGVPVHVDPLLSAGDS